VARGRVRLNSRGMRALLNDPGVRTDLHRRGERVADRARSTAPVDEGTFQGSFTVEDDTTDRPVVRIRTTDPKGAIKEARFRTLTSALDAAR
jgi:hypothetical protein